MNSENQNTSATNSDEISLSDLINKIRELLRYLLSKWLVVIIFSLIGAVLGYTYAYFKKAQYRAVTTFVLEDPGSGGGGLGSLSGLASIAGFDLGGNGGGVFQGDNIIELYKSRTMIEKTLLTEIDYNGKKQLLIDRFIDFNRLRESWAKVPALKDIKFEPTVTFTRLQDSILGTVVNDINRNYLTVDKLDKKLNIIRTEVKARDEFFAKAFNDQIVKNVSDFYVQTKTKKSKKNLNILQHQTDSVRAVMNGAIFSAASNLDATPNLNPTRQSLRAPAQKAQYNAETNKLILGELIKNLELSKMSLQQETPLLQPIDKPVFPLEIETLGKPKGIVLGMIMFGFFTVVFLTFKWMLKK
jgi:hypothetical protein